MIKNKEKKIVSLSQKKASQKYEKETVEQLTIRIPKGCRKKINDYVFNNTEYNSVNTFVKDLIEKELNKVGETIT